MASNEVKLTIRVGDNGTLDIVAKKAKKAKKATEELGTATDQATKSRNRYSKGEKGVAQATANGTKAFSKMRDTMIGGNGLVAAYATLAASVFAVTALFGVLQRAAAVQQLEQGLTAIGQAGGIAMKSLSNGLKEATGNAIALEEAMRSTSMVIGAGFDSSTLERLGTVARNASIALGRDTADSLARLTRGAVKLEPELLDELGIMVRLDEATQEYAKGIGKTANALTSFEKRQAFMNAVLEEGEKKYKALNDGVETNPYDQLAAAFADLTKSLTKFANDALKLDKIVKALADNTFLLAGALLAIGRGAITSAIGALAPALVGVSAAFASAAGNSAKLSANKAKLAATTVKGTKSVNNYAAGLANGERNTKGFNKAMRFGNQSLNSRLGFLKTHIKQNGLFNKTTLAKVKGVRAATVAVNSLAIAEYKAAIATKAHKEQKIFAELAAGNYNRALKRLGIQFARYNKAAKTAAANATLSGKAFIFAGNAAKIAGLGVRFLGAAVMSLLPHLGLILLIIGGLTYGLQKLYEKFYQTEALKEFTDQAIKTGDVLTELAGSMKKIPNQELFSDQVIARANALNTAVAELDSLIEKYGNLDVEPLDDRIVRNLDKIDAKSILSPVLAIPGLLGKETKGMSLADLLGMTGFQTTSQKAIAGLDKFINSSKELKSNFEKIYKGKTLQEVLVGPDGKFDFGLIEEIKQKVIDGEQEKAQKLSAVAVAARGARKALTDYLAKSIVSTDFDELAVASDDFQKSLSESTDGAKVKQLVDELTPLQQRFFGLSEVLNKDMVAGFNNIDNGTGQMAFNYGQYLQMVIAGSKVRAQEIADDRERVSLGKTVTADLKNQLALEKAKAQYPGQSLAIDTAHNALLNEQIGIIDAQLRIKRTTLEAMTQEEQLSLTGKSIAAEILELESKRKKTVQDKVDTEEGILNQKKEALSILQTEQKVAKALLDIQQKQAAAAESMLESRKTAMEINLREQNRKDPQRQRGDDSLTAMQEFKVTKALEADRIKNAQTALKLKVDGINLEYALIGAQYQVLKAEIDVINKRRELENKPPISTKFLDTAIANLDETKNQAIGAAAANYLATYKSITESTTQAFDKAIKGTIEDLATGNIFQKARGMFDKEEGLGANLGSEEGNKFAGLENTEKIDAFRNSVQFMIDDLAKLGPEGELIASVANGAFTVGSAWASAAETIEASVGTAGEGATKTAATLQAVSQTLSAVSQIMQAESNAQVAEIEKQIAAEKKRDGKSAESVAKINALEKKKDKVKRKAFEQQKKMQMGMVAINTAASIAANVAAASNAAAAAGIAAPAVFAGTLGILNGITLALGAAQLAMIAGTSYQGGGSIGGASGAATSVTVGERKSSTDLAKSSGGAGELAYFRGQQGFGGPENFRPAFSGYKNRAEGGNTAFMVGEQGPELFVPEMPGRVVPNDDIPQGVPVNATINISAVDATGVENVLMAQRGNIIEMIREAANAQGDTFLENINVAELR